MSGTELAAAFFPAWSPDSRELVFVGGLPPKENTGPVAGLYRVNPDGSGLRQIGPDGPAPAWSPDGGWIALVVPDITAPGPWPVVPAVLRVMAPDGSGARTVAAGFSVEGVLDPFDSKGSPAPVWRPIKP